MATASLSLLTAPRRRVRWDRILSRTVLYAIVLGSVLLTLLPTIFQPLALYKTLFTGALLVLCFLYLPEGIFGAIARGLERLSQPRGRRDHGVPAAE